MPETVMLDSGPPSFAYLIQLGGPRRGAIYHLHGDRIAIGRTGEGNDIVLGDDSSISGHHANLRRAGDGSYALVDMDSSNGTFVNGERITRQQLGSDDRVKLGKTELVFKLLAG